ncbi:MAG TPA: hypothetical protein VER04_04050 [Polyangiaceae bacterium]|nr:hypothetical protein [Polyangiaceae bacterium]
MSYFSARAQFILCGALLGASALTVSAHSFAVSDAERAGARAAANQGADAFDQGKWAEAVELFGRAEALVHSPIHLSYIARAQLKLGHWVEAYELFNRIKREPLEQPVSTPVANAVADANRQLSTLDAQLPYVTLEVKGTDTQGVTVTMDGATVPSALIGVSHPVNPGPHKFRATSTTQASPEVTVDIKAAARQTVELVLAPNAAVAGAPVAPVAVAAAAATPAQPAPAAPEPPPSPSDSSGSGMRVGGYVALGVGVVGVGLGTVFLLSANSKQKDADAAFDACGGKACSGADRAKVDSLDSDVASSKTLSLTSFVVGGAGLATGATLLVLSGKHKSEPSAQLAPRLQPWVGFRSVGLSGTF